MILRSGHRKGAEHSNIHGRWQDNSEILINIFEYLPLEDRKNAKLVCDNWYKILTRRTFQVKEWICCRGGLLYSTKDIVSTLTTFRCPLYNLKLQQVNVNYWPRKFWRQRGNEIRHLDFQCCRNINVYLDDKSIEFIMEYCTNLSNWSNTVPRDNCFRDEDPNNTTIAIGEHLLDTLIEKKILRSNLVSMKTSVRNLNQSWLFKLFTIFPEIKKLHLHELNSGENVPDHNIFQTLGQYNYIRDSLSYWSSSLSMNELFSAVPSSSCTMLQYLDIGIIKIEAGSGYAENFLLFISKLTTLKSFQIEFEGYDDNVHTVPLQDFVMKLFHTLLDHCTDLHTVMLRYQMRPAIIMDTPLLEKLVKSKLVELDLFALSLDRDLSPNLFVNDTLKCLNIYNAQGGEGSKSLWSSFVQIFQALIHCRISFTCGYLSTMNFFEGLDVVATKLVSLNIEFHFEGEQVLSRKFLHMSMFTRLKYLSVLLAASCKTSMSWLNLPNLEYLFIYYDSIIYKSPSTEDRDFFNTIPNYSPQLKYLAVNGKQSAITYSLIKELCTSLSKLQFLNIICHTIVGNFGLPEIKDLFVSSQSLRFLSVQSLSAEREGANNCPDDIVVFYDPTRGLFKSGKHNQFKNIHFNTTETCRFRINTCVT